MHLQPCWLGRTCPGYTGGSSQSSSTRRFSLPLYLQLLFLCCQFSGSPPPFSEAISVSGFMLPSSGPSSPSRITALSSTSRSHCTLSSSPCLTRVPSALDRAGMRAEILWSRLALRMGHSMAAWERIARLDASP